VGRRPRRFVDRYGQIVVTWIVVGAIVLGVVILAASVGALLGRLRPLNDANRRLRIRLEQAERLQAKVETLQQNMLAMQAPMAEAAERAEKLSGRRPGG
jgi:type II secretory pathway component PulM